MKKVIGILFGIGIACAVLFGIADTITWWNAWAFLVLMVVISAFTQKLINNTPGLAEERKTARTKAKPWDVKFVRMINGALPAMIIVAALDMRFHWFPNMPVAVSIIAFVTIVPAAAITYRAIAVNIFFSSHVRIQQDRGHAVVSSGPYRVVRHPGYTGSILFNIFVPLALGSWGAMVLGIGTALLLVYRTVKEDKVLMEELPGYTKYAQEVRYRLLPGVW